ncbi:anti-sigma factor family protein [Lichenifustis flavocetrariae]|uniref:Anti-sigma factor n=1 Tax=Lichenifustis flavocetrariae TaxID=2949735 RepID=A0AA41Z2I9_9HYPH|nr:anti-sigma factor [Lichenifustis flavocetrariae]MCW6511801.1 anti-sigma factor [Lichenifustis flavocetrariae]
MTADQETFLLLSAYQDGELSPGEALAMERRLAAEPELRQRAERLRTLSGEVRNALATPPASDALRASVVQQIGFRRAAPHRSWFEAWQLMAAVLLVGFFGGGLIGGGTGIWLAALGSQPTEDAVVAGHLRGLIAPQPFDIASSNRHVVKPWFNGRTTVAPDVIDLTDKGYPLAGGRIDVVGGKAVPTLVYRHDQHVISVTVVPRIGPMPKGEDQRDGYTVRHWSAGDLTYWLVSDLDATGLNTFERLFCDSPGGAM